jgi:hypothetical protein
MKRKRSSKNVGSKDNVPHALKYFALLEGKWSGLRHSNTRVSVNEVSFVLYTALHLSTFN